MIRIDAVTKNFGFKTVLNQVTYHFPERGRIALVGANGAGKTTLLDVLTGVSESDSGSVLRPSRLRLGYLPQEPNPNPKATVLEEAVTGGDGYMQKLARRHKAALDAMSAEYSEASHKAWEAIDLEFRSERGYSLESDACSILSGLGFSSEMQARNPKELSGGWRMRLELAKIFINRPNFLVLDEPTNHLDLPSLVWVEAWLHSFAGTLLFVSHDRGLLRRLPNFTLHLYQGRMTEYQGNFDKFLEERERRMEENAARADGLRKRREHLEKFVDRFGAKATKAAQAQSKMKMIARIHDLEAGIENEDDPDMIHLVIPMTQASGREVLRIRDGAIGYVSPLSRKINLQIERTQRVAVIGANGIGKSTLLKTIAEHIPALHGVFELGHNVRMAWFAQDQLDTLNPDLSVLENVLSASARATYNDARNVLGALLFRGQDVDKKVKVLSGGEKARVGLARLLIQDANFIVMDEPTNHLDISSCEILAQALCEYEGTILFVSHDREFIDAVCTHVYAMLADGRGQLFEGKLDDYRRLALKAGFPDVLAVNMSLPMADSSVNTSPPLAEQNNPSSESEIATIRRVTQKNLKRVEILDLEIASLGKIIVDIDHKMEQFHSNFEEVARLDAEKKNHELRLQSLETEWLSLSEDIDRSRVILTAMGRTL
jgi:ATP-binding cassette subfamily F protein 3